MNLIEIIDRLDDEPNKTRVVINGFANPHSYRGYYDCLAFEPARHVTVQSMLDAARSAMGNIYHGYKGGEYKMTADTPVYLATEGMTNPADEAISKDDMNRMLASPPDTDRLVREIAIELYRAELVPEITAGVTAAVRAAVETTSARAEQ